MCVCVCATYPQAIQALLTVTLNLRSSDSAQRRLLQAPPLPLSAPLRAEAAFLLLMSQLYSVQPADTVLQRFSSFSSEGKGKCFHDEDEQIRSSVRMKASGDISTSKDVSCESRLTDGWSPSSDL